MLVFLIIIFACSPAGTAVETKIELDCSTGPSGPPVAGEDLADELCACVLNILLSCCCRRVR